MMAYILEEAQDMLLEGVVASRYGVRFAGYKRGMH